MIRPLRIGNHIVVATGDWRGLVDHRRHIAGFEMIVAGTGPTPPSHSRNGDIPIISALILEVLSVVSKIKENNLLSWLFRQRPVKGLEEPKRLR